MEIITLSRLYWASIGVKVSMSGKNVLTLIISKLASTFTFGNKMWVYSHILSHISGKKEEQSFLKIQFYFPGSSSRDRIKSAAGH